MATMPTLIRNSICFKVQSTETKNFNTHFQFVVEFSVDSNPQVPKTTNQCRAKLREEFLKHQNLSDIRIVDMLVIKGKMELQETVEKWKQPTHMMRYWNDSQEPKPQDFLSKFISGKN